MFGRESAIWGMIAQVAGEAVANQATTIVNIILTIFCIVGALGGMIMLGFHFIKNLNVDDEDKEPMSKKLKRIIFCSFGLMGLGLIGVIIFNVGDSAFNISSNQQGQIFEAINSLIGA